MLFAKLNVLFYINNFFAKNFAIKIIIKIHIVPLKLKMYLLHWCPVKNRSVIYLLIDNYLKELKSKSLL